MRNLYKYIKLNALGVAVSIGVCTFFFEAFITKSSDFSVTRSIGLIIFFIAADPKYRKSILAKRLSKAPLDNGQRESFISRWDETRKNGVVKYCLLYGGFVFGFALFFIISILTLIYSSKMLVLISAEPTNMLKFIGYTYCIGFFVGAVIYWVIWKFNERKFISLKIS